MKVKDLISQLEKKDPNDEMIVAYWEHEAFADKMKKDDWPNFVEIIDNYMSWSETHEAIMEYYPMFMRNRAL